MTKNSQFVSETLIKIRAIWDEIGTDEAYRKNKIDVASQKIIEYYNSFLKNEEKYKEDIIKDIISGLESLCSMSTELGETVNDNHQALSSMTLFQRLEYIEIEKSKLRKRTEDRMAIIEELEAGIDDYSKEMELKDLHQSYMDESAMQGNDYSMDRISSLDRKLKTLKTQRDELFLEVQKISNDIVQLWEELRVSPDTELEKSILLMTQSTIDKMSPISLGQATLTVLEQKRDRLHTIKAEHEEMVCKYATQITLLWDKLEIPIEERESFFAKTAGLGSDVIEACREELERVEEIRNNCLSDLIKKVVEKIQTFYNHLHLPIEKLQKLVIDNNLDMNKDSEELLELYELELTRVGKLYEISKPLLLLIEKRETIRNYKIEYEQTILGDKERLLSKKFDRARFEKEKELSTAFQKLPIIEDNLKKQLLIWDKTYGQPFTYEGFNYLEVMQQQADNEKKLKETEKLRKEREKMQNKVESNGITCNGNNVNINGNNGVIKKSTSTTFNSNNNNNNINSSNISSNNNGPKTPTSSRVFKTVQTPSTPKTPKSKTTLENLIQSPYSASLSTKPLLKKRSPLSPLPIKTLTNTPGGNSNRSAAASKLSPNNKKKIQFSLNNNNQNIVNNKSSSSTSSAAIKRPVSRISPTNTENKQQLQQQQHHSNVSMVPTTVSPTSSISSRSSQQSHTNSNGSYIHQPPQSQYQPQQQQQQQQQQQMYPIPTLNNGIYKSISNDSIMINNHQYNDDLIMDDTMI
ncbi:hypothetical protein ACTFIV_010204 [Dictyostelium citrinum]